jgi:hypothetical protein
MRFGFLSSTRPRPLRQRGTRSARVRLALRAASIAVLVLVLVVVGTIVVVLSGPTEVGILRGRIAASITDSLGPGYTVDVARVVIEVDPVLGFVVRADDIEVRDSGDSRVAFVPSTRLAVVPASLLRLRLDVKQVELSDAEISFVRGGDGAVRLGGATTTRDGAAAPPPGPNLLPGMSDGGFPTLFAALQILDRGIEPPVQAAISAGFERFSLVNGTIVVWDSERRQRRRFPSTDLTVVVDRATAALAVNFATSGYGGRWTATVDREVDATTGGHALSAVFSQLTLADVLPSIGDNQGPVLADIPLYGRATVRYDANGAVEGASARLDLGAGIVRFGVEDDEFVLLDEATVKLRWDISDRVLVVEPSTFFFGETRGVVTGMVRPVGDPADNRYAFAFESPGAILAPRDTGEPPVIAQRIAANGVADFNAKVLSLENAIVVAGEASVALAGSLNFATPSPSLALGVSFSPMSVGALKQVWVPFLAPGSRRFVVQKVSAGRLVSARLEAAIPPGYLWTGVRKALPDDSLRLDMRMEGVTVATFGDLPPVENAAGNIVLAGSTFGVDFDGGVINTASGPVSIDAGAFATPNAAKRPADGVIELQLSGSAAALGEVAEAEPLNALSRRNISPGDLAGEGVASVSVRMPLRRGLTEGDVDWKVVVNSINLSSQAPFQGRLLADANLAITVTPQEVSVFGDATIDGVEADVSMSFPVNELETPAPGTRRVRLVLDDEARRHLGVGLEGVLSGSVTALVSDETAGGVGQRFEVDLRQARLVLPGVGWSKGIGVAATLSLDLVPVADGYSAENLMLVGDGFGFSGSAKLDKTYNLISADVGALSLHSGDQVALKLTRGRSGFGITARGSSLDLRGLITQVRDRNAQAGGFPDLAVDARFDRVIGFNQEEITNAALTLVSVGGETQKMTFSGLLGGSPVSLDYAVTPQGTSLQAHAADAGRLMRYADLYGHIAGGTVTISGQGGPTGPMLGSMQIDSFDVVNEPAMEKVVSPDATQPAATAFDPRRVHFDRLVARFAKTDRSMAIEDALLRSPDVGATFSGRYDFDTTTISLTGTYLPAYAVNNLFSRVPILGFALGGGLREGLIGVTFKIEGPLGQPRVFFNPLSVVAPGILRKIFEFQQVTQ